MATYDWTDITILLVDGFDLLPFLVEELTLPEPSAIIDEFRPVGQAWKRRLGTGVRDTKNPFKHVNLYDADDANSPDALLVALPNGGILSLAIEGGTVGTKAINAVLSQSYYSRNSSGEKFLRQDAEHAIDGGAVTSVILHGQTQETADFNTQASSVDNGVVGSAVNLTSSSVANPTTITTAAVHGLATGDRVLIAGHTSTPTLNGVQTVTVVTTTTFTVPVNVTVGGGAAGTVSRISTRSGGRAYINVPNSTDHPFALGGHTALDADVRHSLDNVTFVELAGFTNITAFGSEEVVATGNVYRYLASGGDFTGAGAPTASPVITFYRQHE